MVLILSAPTTTILPCWPVLDELRAGDQREQEARAGGREIESPGVLRADLLLDQAGRGGEEHVRRDGGDDDQVDLLGAHAPVLQQPLPAPWRPYRALAPSSQMRRSTNAGPRPDPFVGGVDHLLEVGVGEDLLRDVVTYRGNGCSSLQRHVLSVIRGVVAWLVRCGGDTCRTTISSARKIMFLIAFGVERPWPMMETPLTPSSGTPPCSW